MKKKWTRYLAGAALVAVFSLLLLSFSCNTSENKSARTAFAETAPAVNIAEDSLEVVEAVQNVFRAVSESVRPSIVELDVVETKTVQVPSFGFPFDFFFGGDGSDSTQEYKQQGLGSGVIVRRDGNTYYVLTNNHVVGTATEISIKLYDDRVYTGSLVGADERMDIALVSFESKEDIPVAVLGDSDTVQTGDICFAMGTPLGYFSSVTQGIISATGRSGNDIGSISDFIQTDAAINQGNSGGALVNIYGEVIGINTWIASQSGGSQGLGFAIPINNVKNAIDSFIKTGKVTYGWMGVSLVEVTQEYKDELGISNRQVGALASQIFMGSPAAKAGMQAGDYVIKLNGKDVKSTEQLVRDVGNLVVGETAEFVVLRNGKEVTLNVKIESRNDEIVNDNSQLWPGFIAAPLSDEIREELELDKKVQGVVVTNIQPKSPAAAMRLQNGDVITAVNDKPVKNLQEFYSALDLTNNKEIWFDVYNQGHTISTGKYKLQK